MRPELEELNSRLDAMSREDLILSIRRLMEENSEKEAILEINSSAVTEMSIQFQQVKDENAALKKENRELLRLNRDLTDQLQMRKKDLYGRKSEKSSGLADAVHDGDPSDPIEETTDEPGRENPEEPGEDREPDLSELKKALHPGESRRTCGKKSPGKRKKDLDSLPTRTCYSLDVDELNKRYGEGNWRIAFWRKEDTIESVHTVQYHKCTYRPVVSVGLEYDLVCPDPCGKILPGSLASSSLVSKVMYQKVVQCVPSYRMEADFLRSGVPISRQTVTNWINRFSNDLLVIVADHMAELLCMRSYSQCDETFFEVIRDGRKAGTKSFVWVHTTSELEPDHPLIVFRFELTRETEHLRRFYGDSGFAGNITSDAYCSYDVLEKEYAGIHGSGCLMHVRRRFFYSALLIRVNGKDPEALRNLPEIRALSLIDEINDTETPLKVCTSEERLRARQSVVKEKVDAFFDYIKTIDMDDPSYSEKLRDAVRYALNQEKKLRRFLDDPMIPADNGFAERCIKPFACARRNWLFSYSIEGAKAAAALFTLVETAKAHNVHPYYYLKYLLETLTTQNVTKGKSFLDDCMPWSDVYRSYETSEKQSAMRFIADQCPPERPRTPRKKDHIA